MPAEPFPTHDAQKFVVSDLDSAGESPALAHHARETPDGGGLLPLVERRVTNPPQVGNLPHKGLGFRAGAARTLHERAVKNRPANGR